MPTTIHDVAQKAEVGIGTVSSVLNKRRAVNEETRQKVLAAITALDYTPNDAARRLSSGKTMIIAAITPFFTRPSVVERLRGVISIVNQSDYDFTLFSVENICQLRNSIQNVPRRGRVDGLLLFSFAPPPNETKRIIEADIPTVLVDFYHPDFSNIYIDNVKGGYQATKYLIGLGHQRIGYLSDTLDSPFGFTTSQEGLQGYRQALEEANLTFCPHYHRQGSHSLEKVHLLAVELLAQSNPPTAIFAFSDTQAMGVLGAARELNLRVPDDIAVIGFDDIETARFVGLSTIHQELFESGRLGAQLLLDMIANPNRERADVLLSTKLINRRTSERRCLRKRHIDISHC